jgi:hypothetical protein
VPASQSVSDLHRAFRRSLLVLSLSLYRLIFDSLWFDELDKVRTLACMTVCLLSPCRRCTVEAGGSCILASSLSGDWRSCSAVI